jgi:hypothetical protein
VKLSPDKLAAGVGALALLLGVAWFFSRAGEVSAIRRGAVQVALTGADLPAREWHVPAVKPRPWEAMAKREGDEAWRYDLFTPPVIYYHRLTGQFTVTPPDYRAPPLGAGEPEEPAFGLELVAVEVTPFRLQLVGYAGAEGSYLGMFEHGVTGETLLAREGLALADLGLRILELVVRREEIAVPDSMPLTQTVARGRVLDERNGEEVWLSSLERRVTGQPLARLRLLTTGEERLVTVGARLPVGEAVYSLDRIERSPPAVEITRWGGEDVRAYRLTSAGSRVPLAPPP